MTRAWALCWGLKMLHCDILACSFSWSFELSSEKFAQSVNHLRFWISLISGHKSINGRRANCCFSVKSVHFGEEASGLAVTKGVLLFELTSVEGVSVLPDFELDAELVKPGAEGLTELLDGVIVTGASTPMD